MKIISKIKQLEERADTYIDNKMRNFVREYPNVLPYVLMVYGSLMTVESIYEIVKKKQDVRTYIMGMAGPTYVFLGYLMVKQNKREEDDTDVLRL